MTPDLLIVCAVDFEAAPFLAANPGTSRRLTRTGLSVISGRVGHIPYELVVTGPGVLNAAHALTAYLEQSSPGLILQTGIAGVFKETGLAPGDVAIATREHYLHTGVQTNAIENAPLPFDLIDALPLTRKGVYAFDTERVNGHYDHLRGALLKHSIQVVKGRFITVSCITASPEQAQQLYAGFSPVMEAMEGAACAHIAALYDIPMIEVRAASNFVGERDRSKWRLGLAARHLARVCALITP